MANLQKGKALRELHLGFKVDRAASGLLAALTPIFTITGGVVLMTGFWGQMTIVGGANNVHIEATPTVGASQPLAANLDVDAMVVGDIITILGSGASAAVYSATAGGLQMLSAGPIILQTGTLDYHAAAAEGTMKWSITYIPLTDGAYVTAT